MAYSVEEEEGPKCSFAIYLAEGDALAKQGDFVKAIRAYSTALEIQPEDKNCLVNRSRCHLKLGDADSALKDAETSLKEGHDFCKGLFQKAEALYAMGDFEFALVHYHRGNKLRPELDEFRLGIQKAREAIDNSIGNPNTVKLTSKGDLSYFYKYLDEKAGKKGKPAARKKPVARAPFSSLNAEKQEAKCVTGDKTVKQLLGELYEDREYLEKLLNDSRATKQSDNTIKSLVSNGITYLDSRLDFWRQQQPLYSRKKKKIDVGNRQRLIKGIGNDPTAYVLRNLDEIDAALADGKPTDSLQLARGCLKKVKQIDSLPNKQEFVANLHSSIGCALLELGNYDAALSEHKEDLALSNSIKSEEGKARALDNIGRTYARISEYSEAIKYWEQRIPMNRTLLESAWLFHELGRCCLELGKFADASSYGEQSLDAATQATDENWQINSSVLIAQAEVKQCHDSKALENFNRALKIAEVLGDKAIQDAISKAIQDVNYRIAEDLREDVAAERATATPSDPTPAARDPTPPAKDPTPAPKTPTPAPKTPTPTKEPTPPPKQRTPPPKQPTPPPPKEATPPPPKEPTPAPKEPTPAPKEPTPAPKEPTPAPKEPTPAPKEPTPAPKEPTPAPKEPTPAPKEPTPAPKEPTPAPKEPTSAPKEPTPAPIKEPTPAPKEPTPAPKEPTPAPKEPTPAPKEPTPAPKEPTPAPKEPTPAPKEPTPAPKEPTPAPKEPTPAPKEPTPAPKEPTPAPKEPTPAPKEPTPAPKEPTPAPKEPTPSPKEPTPAPKEPTPAPKEPTPSPKEPTPAPKEPTPAPKEPTPAPKEPTPAPAQATPAPAESTPAPVQSTPAPVQSTPAPVESTPAPKETTPAPAAESTPAPAETTPAAAEATHTAA